MSPLYIKKKKKKKFNFVEKSVPTLTQTWRKVFVYVYFFHDFCICDAATQHNHDHVSQMEHPQVFFLNHRAALILTSDLLITHRGGVDINAKM